MKLFVSRHADYRSGTRLQIDELNQVVMQTGRDIAAITREMEDDEDWLTSLVLPDGDYRDVYAIYLTFGDDDTLWQIYHLQNEMNESKAKDFLQQVYSDLNGHQPFVVTNLTSGYKEDGYYPDALPFINGQSCLKREILDAVNALQVTYCLGLIVHDGHVIDTLQILPVF